MVAIATQVAIISITSEGVSFILPRRGHQIIFLVIIAPEIKI